MYVCVHVVCLCEKYVIFFNEITPDHVFFQKKQLVYVMCIHGTSYFLYSPPADVYKKTRDECHQHDYERWIGR